MVPKGPLHPRGSRGQPELTRQTILEAATREFAAEGLAGARTDAIAKAARVNKALLYYYFRDKEGLYGAVLDHAFAELLNELFNVLDSDLPPGERLLTHVITHFTYVAAHPHYRRLVQHEMIRAGTGSSPHFPRLVESVFQPLLERMLALLREGMARGEFRSVDPLHFIQSMNAVVVYYFASPILRAVTREDPLSSAALRKRAEAMLDFLAAALFADHTHAEETVRKVIAQKYSALEPTRTRGKKK